MRILPLAAALVLGTAAHAQQPAAPDAVPASGVSAARTVTVDMKDGKGQSVGTVQIRQLAHGTLFLADLRGLPPGAHGFHVHERGSCQAPDFKSAGSHYNPEQSEHGYGSGGGPHPGDLPNLHVTQQGTVTAEIHSSRLSLVDEDSAATGASNGNPTPTRHGGPFPMLDDDGSAIVIHAKGDDYTDMDSAGARIACGVVATGK